MTGPSYPYTKLYSPKVYLVDAHQAETDIKADLDDIVGFDCAVRARGSSINRNYRLWVDLGPHGSKSFAVVPDFLWFERTNDNYIGRWGAAVRSPGAFVYCFFNGVEQFSVDLTE